MKKKFLAIITRDSNNYYVNVVDENFEEVSSHEVYAYDEESEYFGTWKQEIIMSEWIAGELFPNGEEYKLLYI